ncbi:hypothetical protein Tco_0659369 [Tanacetum coccineum]
MSFEATKDSLKRFGVELHAKTAKRLKIDDKDAQSIKEKAAESKRDEPTKKKGKRRKQITRKGLHTDKDEKDEDSDKDEVLINPVPVLTKPPIKVYISYGAMLKDITRDDLTELFRIVMQRYRMDGLEDDYEKEAHNGDTQRKLKFTSEDQVRGGLLGNIVNRLKSGSYRVKSGRHSAYNLRIATPRAVVHAGDKISGDARSWYMISGNAKSWVVIVLLIFTVCFDKVVLHDALRALVDMLLVAMLIEDVSLLVGTDIESDLEEAPSEVEEFQQLVSRAPITDEEFKVLEPSDTRITLSHSSASSDSIDYTYGRAYLADPIPGHVSRIAKAAALSPSSFYKRYRSSYETSSSSSLTLPTRKRYRGTSELILDTKTEDESSDSDAEREGYGLDDEGQGLDDEGHGLDDDGHGLDDEGHGLEDEGPTTEEEEEEAAPEGQQQAVQVMDTAVDEPLGLGYRAARRRALESTGEIAPNPEDDRVYTNILTYAPLVAPVQTSPSLEWSSGAQLELHGSILHDHTQRLDALPPTLFEGYDRDLRELYTRSREVRDEIFSQRYRFRSLEQEQKRATLTFGALWRLVLALEAWTRHVDTRMVEMLRDKYDDHKLIHDMLVQHAAMQREL